MRSIVFVLTVTFFLLLSNPVLAKRTAPTPIPEPIPQSICLDAGHGSLEEIGTSNGDLLEKDVNLRVALLLKDRLINEAGYVKDETLFLTRETDVAMSSADRYNFCNSRNASILISIHHNGSTNPEIDYSLALYMKKSDIPLSKEVVNSISKTLGIPNNGISRFAAGVLLKSEMPATISEGFFLTNTNEYELIKTNRLDQEVDALFTAINNYFD